MNKVRQQPRMAIRQQPGFAQRAACTTLCSIGVLMASLSHSTAADTVASTQVERRTYQLAAGPLATRLNELARYAGVVLSFDPALVSGKSGRAVTGAHTPAEAFALLLQGADLEIVLTSSGRYTLRQIPGGTDSALPQIDVTTAKFGIEGPELTEGTGSYTTPATRAATGLSLSLRDTPQSVTVLTQQVIEDQNLVSLSQALTKVPGVYVTSLDSDRADFYARGFYIDSVQYDGVPSALNSAFYGDANGDSIIYDRMEVVRGSTGLLSGAGDPSASINLIRKHADSKVFTGNVSAGAGSWNRHRASVDLTTPLSADGRVRGRLIASFEERDSHVDLYHSRKQVLYGIVDIDLTPVTRLSIGADYQANRPTGSTWGALPVIFGDGTEVHFPTSKSTAARWTRWYSTNKTIFANLEHNFDNGWKLKASASRRESDYDSKLLYLSGMPDSTTGLGMRALSNYSEYRFSQNNVSAQAVGPFELFGRKHELVIGAMGSYSQNVDAGHTPVPPAQTPGSIYDWNGSYREPVWGPLVTKGTRKKQQTGIYAATRLTLTDKLKFIVGGRQSNWQTQNLPATKPDRNHDVFTPYAGAVYDINDVYSVYASYTSVFQPQTNRKVNGDYLDPVTGVTYEAGIKGEHFGGAVNTSLSVFKIRQNNVAKRDGNQLVSGTSELAYYGTDGINSRGIEMQVSGELTRGWNVMLGASYSRAQDANNVAFNTEMPRSQATLSTSYRFSGGLSGLTVGGGMNWESGSYTLVELDNEDIKRWDQKGFVTASLMARYEFTPNLSGQLNINNVFNKTYYASINDVGTGQYGTPRNAMATLKYKF